MPISQSRVLLLLDEIQLLLDKSQLLVQCLAQGKDSGLSSFQITTALSLYSHIPALVGFETESRHFRSNARRNIKQREKMTRLRESRGTTRKLEQPRSFIELDQKGKTSFRPLPTEQELQQAMQDIAIETDLPEGHQVLDESLWKD